MSNNKQSSLEMMWDEIDNLFPFKDSVEAQKFCAILDKYKAMHKQEIENAFVECWKANMPDGYECKLSAKEYYNETFGDEKK